ncbi:hypothetical protein DSO57_1028366 [Entomophthora muscae]|uniref:Uncharacterized protein n=1 Tax=Entomophthora muscae TaxID=34485 RepID=A0ACC2RSE4_9FUNG|nr:hypothetical protein DSO57_1028366 [Entomophthora muscae]
MFTFASVLAIFAAVVARPAEDAAASSIYSQYEYPIGRSYEPDYYGYPTTYESGYSMRRREAEAYRTTGPAYSDGRRSYGYRQSSREAYAYARARSYAGRGHSQGYAYESPSEQMGIDDDQIPEEIDTNHGIYRRSLADPAQYVISDPSYYAATQFNTYPDTIAIPTDYTPQEPSTQ